MSVREKGERMAYGPDLGAGEPKQTQVMSEGCHPANCAPGPHTAQETSTVTRDTERPQQQAGRASDPLGAAGVGATTRQ